MGRSIKDYVFLFFKGIAMGAADVVPGVSGGTIAFISGIYEELLVSISNINLKTISILKQEGFKGAWNSINGNFLATLLAGIGFSVITLAKGISFLLDTEPILLWSFFFGLVVASVIFIGKQITQWNFKTILAIVIGTILAYNITILEPLVTNESSLFFYFISGALAICAMILPGISGSFILVLLGSYKMILEAIHSRDLKLIFTVGLGVIVGLLSFSKVLKWLFFNYKNLTLAALTGFIIGSLNKIWPWKETLSWRTNSHGEEVPLLQKSVNPFLIEDNQIFFSIAMAIVGYAVILILEKIEKEKKLD
jgi:putative membrane protein